MEHKGQEHSFHVSHGYHNSVHTQSHVILGVNMGMGRRRESMNFLCLVKFEVKIFCGKVTGIKSRLNCRCTIYSYMIFSLTQYIFAGHQHNFLINLSLIL